MKRLFYIFSLAMLAGCSDNNQPVAEAGQNEAIAFGVESVTGIDNALTRGYVVENPRHFHRTMAVYAYQYSGTFDATGANRLMDHLIVRNEMPTPGDERWYYAPIVRWPRTEETNGKNNVRFLAYAPAIDVNNSSVMSVSESAGLPVLSYTVPTIVNDQHDVLIADYIDRTISESNSAYTAEVDFKFYHMLSAIRFKMVDDLDINCTIKKISLEATDLKQSAQFYLANHQMVPNSGTSGNVTYTVDLSRMFHSTGGFKWDKDNKPQGDETIITRQEDTFFVIPQDIVAASATSGAKVKATIEVDIEGIEGTQTVSCDLDPQTWEMGKLYTYTVNIKFPTLYITLAGTSLDWTLADEEFAFTANDEISLGWISYPRYSTPDIWGHVAVAAGEVITTYTDEHGTQITVNTHAPARSAIFNLQTSSDAPLKLKISNEHAKLLRFLHDDTNPDNSHWEASKYDELTIPAGDNVLTTFSVVPDTETFGPSDSRVAYLTLEEEGNSTNSSPHLLSFIADNNLPYNDDHTQMGFQLLTPSEWDSGTNITIINKN